jgi:hypothetical protein
MKPWTIVILAVFLVAAISSRASAQVHIGTIELQLGDSKVATLEQLRREFRVDSITDDDHWGIYNLDGPPYVAVGSVAFRTGRISLITREWSPGVGEATQADLMRAIVAALQTLLNDRQANCTLLDRSNRSPRAELSAIDVRCGNRRVSLTHSRFQGRPYVNVAEIVETGH